MARSPSIAPHIRIWRIYGYPHTSTIHLLIQNRSTPVHLHSSTPTVPILFANTHEQHSIRHQHSIIQYSFLQPSPSADHIVVFLTLEFLQYDIQEAGFHCNPLGTMLPSLHFMFLEPHASLQLSPSAHNGVTPSFIFCLQYLACPPHLNGTIGYSHFLELDKTPTLPHTSSHSSVKSRAISISIMQQHNHCSQETLAVIPQRLHNYTSRSTNYEHAEQIILPPTNLEGHKKATFQQRCEPYTASLLHFSTDMGPI